MTKTIVPKGWKKIKLGQLFDFRNGVNADKASYGEGVRFINVMEIIKNNVLMKDSIPGKIMLDGKKMEKNLVIYGDILFNRTSETPEEIGLTSVYLDTEKVVFGGFVIRARSKNKQIKDGFKKYCFSSLMLRKEIIRNGQGVVRMNIGQEDLSKISIILPLFPEQEKITDVLEAWDDYLEKLTKAIKLKKEIKKGLMQKLLTGKIRLPGFTDEWKTVKLREICKRIKTGKLDANAMVENGKYRFYTCAKNYYQIDEYAFDTEALLVSGNGANVGYIHYYKGKFNAYQRTYVLDKFVSDIHFTKYVLDKHLKKRIFEEKCDGNTPYIKMDTLTDMKVLLPKSKQEQTTIAQILTTADQEIEALEKRKNIIEKQKKFLLNNLITGRIRLPGFTK